MTTFPKLFQLIIKYDDNITPELEKYITEVNEAFVNISTESVSWITDYTIFESDSYERQSNGKGDMVNRGNKKILPIKYTPDLQKFGINNRMSVAFTGRNLLTFTNYTGYDPEVGSSSDNEGGSSVLTRIDGFTYPNFKTYTLTLELEL